MEYAYNENAAFGKWAFGGGRKSGDIVMLDNGAGIYTVYYLETAPYRKENQTKNYRYLVFNGDESADEALAAFEAGEKTGEAFAALAEGKTDEMGDGALQEKTDLGETSPVIEAWLFDSARKPGDVGKLEYGDYRILVYFEGDGGVSWKNKAEKAIVSDAVNAGLAEYQKKYEIKSDLDNVYYISGENAFTREAANEAESEE